MTYSRRLQQLGAEVASESGNGCPPVVVRTAGLPGGRRRFAANFEPVFKRAADGGAIRQAAGRDPGRRRSRFAAIRPYDAGRHAIVGVVVDPADLTRFVIPNARPYHGLSYDVEPDASAASYFWAATGHCRRASHGRGTFTAKPARGRRLRRRAGANGLPREPFAGRDYGSRR